MNDWAEDLRSSIDRALEEVLPAEGTPPEPLHRAMRYAVLPGGKRVRPLLALAAALAASRCRLGESHDASAAIGRAMPCAIAVELVHSYSLIHDDLPAMDDDDFRRGRPTVHKAFGEALAILAGDALLPLAFEVLASERARELMGAGPALACAGELARGAGSLGMAGGQTMDLGSAGGGAGPGLLERLADLKTGALIKASVRCGAIACDAAPPELAALTRFAELYGRAFQVFDDVKDVGQDRAVADHTRRARPQLQTFPMLLGVSRAKAYGDSLVAQAVAELARLPRDAAELAHLARQLQHVA